MKKIIAVLLVFSLVILSGCGTADKKDEKNIIAVSFYPIYIFTLNLVDGIDGIELQSVGEQNAGCLHDYTITAKDAKLLSDATVLVINGAGMEAFLEDMYSVEKDLEIIDTSVGAEVLASSHQHHHHHEDGEHNELCSEITLNSHIWLSVENAKIQVKNIKDGLVKYFPQFSSQIDENYLEYNERLNDLQKEELQAKKYIQGKDVYAFHEAYSYLSNDLGFNIVKTIETDEGGEPSAKKIAELSSEAEKENIKAILVEPFYEGSAAEIVANEACIKICTLNPITSGAKKKTAYEDIMRENIKVLKAVN